MKYELLLEIIIRLKKIKNMEDICCATERDKQMKRVFTKLNEKFGMNLDTKRAEVGYDNLRMYIIENDNITDEQKINLLKIMK